jgi:flagellar biosynthesis protein FlhF
VLVRNFGEGAGSGEVVIVKRFVGDNVEMALYLARAELGHDAVILSSGPTRDAWWRFWQRRYQVLAAADVAPATPTAVLSEAVAGRSDPPRAAPKPDAEPPSDAPDAFRDEVVDMLKGLDRRLRTLAHQPEGAEGLALECLLTAQIDADLARGLAARVVDAGDGWRPALVDQVAEALGPPAPVSLKEPVILTAVGPTGSGKTTTLAKLAAHFRLAQQKSVLLVTTDTFRVAATEQLKTFALILGVPFEVAARPQELEQIVDRSAHDVILVDTAGRSPFHDLHMAEIQSLVRAARTQELLVVLPATMRTEAMVHAARRFAGDRSAKLCFTKLDESDRPGAMISATITLGWPLSYISDGQDVPEDIAIADARRLAEWVVQGVDYHG